MNPAASTQAPVPRKCMRDADGPAARADSDALYNAHHPPPAQAPAHGPYRKVPIRMGTSAGSYSRNGAAGRRGKWTRGHQQHGQRGQHAQGGKAKCVFLLSLCSWQKAPLEIRLLRCRAARQKKRPFMQTCTKGRAHAVAALFLSSGLYRRLWNFTKSARRAAFAFVGFHHRWGISPRPETSFAIIIARGTPKCKKKRPAGAKTLLWPAHGHILWYDSTSASGAAVLSPPPRKKPRPRRHAALCAAVQGRGPPAGARGLLF